jgi:8-oxo-dGTP pyrophosphatase MutT (NUDIX family)
VLLLQGRDPDEGDGPRWWFTPGGGIEQGEQPVDALRRECWEELGLRLDGARGPIARQRYEFPFAGAYLVQDTLYYWAQVPHFDPAPQRLSALEQRFLLGWRWWTMAELATPPETVYPSDLLRLIQSLPGIAD